MLRTFTAKAVLIFFVLGTLCVTLAAPGVFLTTRGIANTSLPGGCAEKIPLLPGKKSQRSGVLCTSDQIFDVLSVGFIPSQAHALLGSVVAPADGLDGVASLKHLFHTSNLTYPLQKVPIHLSNLVLTL